MPDDRKTPMRDGSRRAAKSRGGWVYRVGDTYSVANGGGWLPGIYADEDAAERALQVRDFAGLDRAVHYSVRGAGDDYRPVTVADLAHLDPRSSS